MYCDHYRLENDLGLMGIFSGEATVILSFVSLLIEGSTL